MNRRLLCTMLVALTFSSTLLFIATGVAAEPCRQAHAHNDYLHDRPLLDALDHGFCSVEADIYLIDGELLVAHDLDKTSIDRTLQKLYLDPLRERINKFGGSVHGDGQTLTLLIDIKSEAETTYRALAKVLADYREMLTYVDGHGIHRGPVTVVISGNRAFDVIRSDMPRYAGIDGRMVDIDEEVTAVLMPLISDNWGRHFRWRGEGPMVPAERRRLQEAVKRAHAAGRRLRFWATPDNEAVWTVLADENVDLINTDDLAGLSQFLRSRK